jgi:hypothetical protein
VRIPTTLVAMVLLGPPGRVHGAPRICPAAVVKALAACIGDAAGMVASCAGRTGGRCADPASRAAARLRRALAPRCPAGAIGDAGYPPPLDPTTFVARLAGVCRANATALAARGRDVLGPGGARPCRRALETASTRLARAAFAAAGACALAGSACRSTAVARRVAAVEEQSRRTATRRCGTGLPRTAVAGVLARARAQATCALAAALPGTPPCAPAGPEALVDLWGLASPRPPGTLVSQVSSYDRCSPRRPGTAARS